KAKSGPVGDCKHLVTDQHEGVRMLGPRVAQTPDPVDHLRHEPQPDSAPGLMQQLQGYTLEVLHQQKSNLIDFAVEYFTCLQRPAPRIQTRSLPPLGPFTQESSMVTLVEEDEESDSDSDQLDMAVSDS
ncbi:hypothetical protein A6R68_04134, partial [Neotoma lepida]